MLELMRSIELLAPPPRLEEVVGYYVKNSLLPAGMPGDAYHLAMASLHGVEFLLTWNCRHLANANKIRHIQVINDRLGLPVPVITTPLSLLPEEMG